MHIAFRLFLAFVVSFLVSCSSSEIEVTAKETFRGNIVDIENQQVYPGEIIVENGIITGINKVDKVKDDSPYFMPGFIDAHIHIESSMLTPVNFARIAVTHGTVSVIADPHEIANVLGEEGIDFMIDNAAASRFNFYFGLPSCVPSSHLESSGAVIDSKATARLIQRPDIHFLAEMMNYPGVVYDDPEVMAKLSATRSVGKPIDGHAPGLLGADLDKYIAAGISTDHECSTLEEALQRLDRGMFVVVREGSSARNFDALALAITLKPELVMLCSDDKHPDDLISGHIDGMIRRGLAMGISVWDLLRAACINPVDHYRIDSGKMRVGDKANFIAVDNLKNMNVVRTILDGHTVYSASTGLIDSALNSGKGITSVAPNKFAAEPITAADIHINTDGYSEAQVIEAYDGSLTTGKLNVPVSRLNNGDIQKIVVYNRYGNGSPRVAYIKGFDLNRGAIGATIAHDSHNIVAIGADDESIVRAINSLISYRGGIVVVDDENVSTMPLPIAGLMTDEPGENVAVTYRNYIDKAKVLGCTFRSPFITMSFMALPVIPELKLTDKGLVDVTLFDFVPLLK